MARKNNGKMITTHRDRDEPGGIPPVAPPPRDMRPQTPDRAKIKAGRAAARQHRRRRRRR